MTTPSKSIVQLLLLLSAHQLFAQNWWYDCPQTYFSPDHKYAIRCAQTPGTPEECITSILSLKGAGIKDSMVVSSTSCHDCHAAQFYWSKNTPLLIVETNNNQCEGPRVTQVFDLQKHALKFSTEGQIWLFDEKEDLVILSQDTYRRKESGSIAGQLFQLYAYDAVKNQKKFIFSIEKDGVMWDEFEGPILTFDPKTSRTLSIQLPTTDTPQIIKISY